MSWWREMIVAATCLAVGCGVVGLVEWYILAYGVVDLMCAVDPSDPHRCVPPWEPTPKPWLAASVAFGSLALVGLARIEFYGLRRRDGHRLAGR